MNKLKYLLAISIGITLLNNTPALYAEEQTSVSTTIEALTHAGVGNVNDGVLHISATQTAQLLKNNPDIKVLDVRTQWEYNRGHISDAVQINYYSFGFKNALNTLDKNATWVVHCKSGVRSGNTLSLMKKAGFKSIIHMDDGSDGWRAAKLPISTAE